MPHQLLTVACKVHTRSNALWAWPLSIALLAIAACQTEHVGCVTIDEASPPATLEREYLRVSPSRRYLTYQDGTPFFWLADTGWTIVGLTKPDIDLYFHDRSSKGFNVIQINTLAYFWRNLGWRVGVAPFHNDNPDTPNETFWSDMDWIVDRAKAHGLHAALFLGWGYHYPALFGNDTAKAMRFGRWVGTRYRDRSNVVWFVAGEYDLNRTSTWSAYEAVARGLIEGDGNHLITIHPAIPTKTQTGIQSSSVHWHHRSWLSFNVLQSGHVDDLRSAGMLENYQMIEHDYRLNPAKPVLDAEPAYEDTLDGIWLKWPSSYRIGADVMRRKAYWSVFAGAAGHTYGHNDVYRFWRVGEATLSGSRHDWVDSLQAPGANQMRHLKTLMEGRSFDRVPDQKVLASDAGTGRGHVQVTRATSRRDALVYIPTGTNVSINTNSFTGWVRATWFDPREGTSVPIGTFANTGVTAFDPPGNPMVGNDWVLVLDAVPNETADVRSTTILPHNWNVFFGYVAERW